MGGLTPAHLIFILVIALIVIGPGKLPETGAALGKALRSFREASGGLGQDPTAAPTATPPAPAPAPADPGTGASEGPPPA